MFILNLINCKDMWKNIWRTFVQEQSCLHSPVICLSSCCQTPNTHIPPPYTPTPSLLCLLSRHLLTLFVTHLPLCVYTPVNQGIPPLCPLHPYPHPNPPQPPHTQTHSPLSVTSPSGRESSECACCWQPASPIIKDRLTDEWVGVNEWLDGWMSVWKDGWVDEKEDKWMNEWLTHDILIWHKCAK